MGCGWREAGRLLPAGPMPVCRGLHSQLTRMRCIRGLVPALWGSPEGDERLASWIWPWSLKPGWAPVASCRPGPSRENPLHARDRKASAPEARGAMFLINSQVGPPALLPRPSGCPALLFSFPCGSWAFISSFQNRTRPGPGLLCAQEARRLSPAAPGGRRVAPLRTGSTAWAGLPGPEAAGPPRTRASSASSLTRPEKAAHWVSTPQAGAFRGDPGLGAGMGRAVQRLPAPASCLACPSRRAVTPARECAHTPRAPGAFFRQVSPQTDALWLRTPDVPGTAQADGPGQWS